MWVKNVLPSLFPFLICTKILTELNLYNWSIDNQNLVFDNSVRFSYDSNATINCLSPQEICDKLKL